MALPNCPTALQVTKLAEQLALLHRQQLDQQARQTQQHQEQAQHAQHGGRRSSGRQRGGVGADQDPDIHRPSKHHSELSELRRQLQVR